MSRHQRYLVIFARAPRLGIGKRRLAADIGRIAAWRFYRNNLITLIHRLSGGPWTLVLAVSQASDVTHPAFSGLNVMVQNSGDLGRRMAGVFRELAPVPAIVIGSDIPGIERAEIDRAFAALKTRDAVFGPAPDGGYWLVGMAGRKPVPRGFMGNVRWSTRHALADTEASLPGHYSVSHIQERADVDDGLSYRAWRRNSR